jgi:hypothetical protein
MSRKRNKGQETGNGENQSLRQKIKTFRHTLHGNVAAAFDKAFFTATGENSLKKALTQGKNLQSAYVAARNAAAEAERGHPIVEVPFVEEGDNE